MSGSVNKVILLGRFGKDPEVKYTQGPELFLLIIEKVAINWVTPNLSYSCLKLPPSHREH